MTRQNKAPAVEQNIGVSQECGVRRLADKNEGTVGCKLACFPCLVVLQVKRRKFRFCPLNPITSVCQRTSILGSAKTLSWMIWLAVKASATSEDGDFVGKFGEKQALFDGAVATADDGDMFTFIEGTIAGGAESGCQHPDTRFHQVRPVFCSDCRW